MLVLLLSGFIQDLVELLFPEVVTPKNIIWDTYFINHTKKIQADLEVFQSLTMNKLIHMEL